MRRRFPTRDGEMRRSVHHFSADSWNTMDHFRRPSTKLTKIHSGPHERISRFLDRHPVYDLESYSVAVIQNGPTRSF
jgi:hypothetical protein